MKKTRKLLSILLAAMLLFGCLGLNAFALELPAEITAGTANFRGLAEISSVEIPVDAIYTELDPTATFTVYYSAEKEEDILDAFNREEVATIGAGDAYLAENVLHINLKGAGLSAEGYYYITIGSGSLVYVDENGFDRYNVATTTAGVQYQFESLAIGGKLSAIFDFIVGMFTNLLANSKTY